MVVGFSEARQLSLEMLIAANTALGDSGKTLWDMNNSYRRWLGASIIGHLKSDSLRCGEIVGLSQLAKRYYRDWAYRSDFKILAGYGMLLEYKQSRYFAIIRKIDALVSKKGNNVYNLSRYAVCNLAGILASSFKKFEKEISLYYAQRGLEPVFLKVQALRQPAGDKILQAYKSLLIPEFPDFLPSSSEVANKAGFKRDFARYWCPRLGLATSKERRANSCKLARGILEFEVELRKSGEHISMLSCEQLKQHGINASRQTIERMVEVLSGKGYFPSRAEMIVSGKIKARSSTVVLSRWVLKQRLARLDNSGRAMSKEASRLRLMLAEPNNLIIRPVN